MVKAVADAYIPHKLRNSFEPNGLKSRPNYSYKNTAMELPLRLRSRRLAPH